MSTLTDLIAQVELELKDTANERWSDDELTAHIRRALGAYTSVAPQRLAATIDTAADVREYSLASLAGLMEVTDLWYPWDEDEPAYPPPRPHWSMVRDGWLLLEVDDAPTGDGTDVLRVFYTAPHTIQGLDGATASTLDQQGEQLVILGATAYAAMQRAQSLMGTVTVSGWTPRQFLEWATARAKAFEVGLEQVRRRAIMAQDARTSWKDEG
jgi:hypothetical protein